VDPLRYLRNPLGVRVIVGCTLPIAWMLFVMMWFPQISYWASIFAALGLGMAAPGPSSLATEVRYLLSRPRLERSPN
jgi:hypothetical protein